VSPLLSSRVELSHVIRSDGEHQYRRAGHSTPQINLGRPGRCPEKPILFIGDSDNSGSVSGVGGNDPVANRFAELRLAIDTVADRCRCGDELVALLNFDSPTSVDVSPTAMRGGMSVIERGLKIPADGGGSSMLGSSLALARNLIDHHPEHQGVLVVLSDFELLDRDVPGVLKDLCEFPGLVHAVVLRSVPPRQLVDDPRVAVTPVTHSDPPGALAKAVFRALTATRRSSGR
jgi:hypothetical protein